MLTKTQDKSGSAEELAQYVKETKLDGWVLVSKKSTRKINPETGYTISTFRWVK